MKPAFPFATDLPRGEFHGGMTIREYFAAHAPEKPARWFKPEMPPEPDKNTLTAAEYEEKDFDWRRLLEIRRTAQWPWAWADAVLAAGDIPEPEDGL
jgi:hypothetical protein